MNISKYSAFFHDGSIINIEHGSNVEISMESSEIDQEDLNDAIPLSENRRIKGKLHLEGIRKIQVNGARLEGKLKMTFDTGGIIDFQLSNGKTKMCIDWMNFPAILNQSDCSIIEIEAKKIWWENIPHLYDPSEKDT